MKKRKVETKATQNTVWAQSAGYGYCASCDEAAYSLCQECFKSYCNTHRDQHPHQVREKLQNEKSEPLEGEYGYDILRGLPTITLKNFDLASAIQDIFPTGMGCPPIHTNVYDVLGRRWVFYPDGPHRTRLVYACSSFRDKRKCVTYETIHINAYACNTKVHQGKDYTCIIANEGDGTRAYWLATRDKILE